MRQKAICPSAIKIRLPCPGADSLRTLSRGLHSLHNNAIRLLSILSVWITLPIFFLFSFFLSFSSPGTCMHYLRYCNRCFALPPHFSYFFFILSLYPPSSTSPSSSSFSPSFQRPSSSSSSSPTSLSADLYSQLNFIFVFHIDITYYGYFFITIILLFSSSPSP